MARWSRRSSNKRNNRKAPKEKKKQPKDPNKASLDQGMFYFYLIIGSQVVFIFGLVAFIMGIGKVLATPWWIFLFGFLLLISGCVYLYRKIKQKLRHFRDAVKEMDLGSGGCEISLMGGFLTMRMGQPPPRTQHLLDAPSGPPPVVDAEAVEHRSASNPQ
jgi:hypothetical protein